MGLVLISMVKFLRFVLGCVECGVHFVRVRFRYWLTGSLCCVGLCFVCIFVVCFPLVCGCLIYCLLVLLVCLFA